MENIKNLMEYIYSVLNFMKWQIDARSRFGSIRERIYYGNYYKDLLTCDDPLYYVYWNDIHRSDLKKFLLGTFGTTNEDYQEFIDFLNRNYANGKFYEIPSLNGNIIKILIPKEEDYKCFKAEFLDIIMPSLLSTAIPQPFLEGPYECCDVQIRENANVLDLGANFGLFSALASSKGAHVYAFEVTPQVLNDYLMPLSEADNNISIISSAVSDTTGEAFFHLHPTTSSCNHLTNDHPDDNTIKVPTISIDDFVTSRHLTKVDFIKADIEGAERFMLCGAFETLREYAPDLAICYYHKLDDEEVLTDLILDANPDYQITKLYKKIYARSRKKMYF